MLRLSYRSVNTFFGVSCAMTPLLTNMGVSKEKICIVHNPVILKQKIKTDLKKRLGIKGKVIIYAGRLSEEKGVQNVIRSLQYTTNVTFLVLGEKKGYYDTLKKLVSDLNLTKKVIFTGFVNQEDIAKYYSIANAAVLVEKYYEPLSRFLLEACSYGLPIIANDIGGNNEVVDHDTGVLLKGNNINDISKAIEYVLDEKNNRRMSKNCIEKITNCFSASIIGKKLCEEYMRLK